MGIVNGASNPQDKKTVVYQEDYFQEFVDGLKSKKYSGFITGVPCLDRNIRPQATDLIVVGSRTSVGKTAFLANILVSMLREKVPCLYCPTESKPDQFLGRIAPMVVPIPADKFRGRGFSTSELAQVGNIVSLVGSMPLAILDAASPNISEIRAAVKSSGCKVVFIDSLSRCSMPPEATRALEIERFMVDLKTMCIELNVLCFLSVQLTRTTALNRCVTPGFTDIAGPSAIENEADAVVFLWHNPKNEGDYSKTKISGVIAKNRHGRLDIFNLDLHRDNMRMLESSDGIVGYW
jgi:replicative DNA helicase